MKRNIHINDKIITIKTSQDGEDYISLTDIAKFKNPEFSGFVITKWLSKKYSIQFIGLWEQLYNPDFNVTEFGNIKNSAGTHDFILSTCLPI